MIIQQSRLADSFSMQLKVGGVLDVKDSCGRVYHAKVIALDRKEEKIKVK